MTNLVLRMNILWGLIHQVRYLFSRFPEILFYMCIILIVFHVMIPSFFVEDIYLMYEYCPCTNKNCVDDMLLNNSSYVPDKLLLQPINKIMCLILWEYSWGMINLSKMRRHDLFKNEVMLKLNKQVCNNHSFEKDTGEGFKTNGPTRLKPIFKVPSNASTYIVLQ